MNLQCEVCVDYLNQARKPTKKAKSTIKLVRDEWQHICLVIGPKSKKLSIRIEGIIGQIYDRFVNDGKATIELNLPGGSLANVLISGAEVIALRNFILTIKKIRDDPLAAAELELDQPDEEAVESI